MDKVVQNKCRTRSVILFCLFSISTLLSACQKNPPAESAASIPAASEPITLQPTGLVKNAIRHNEQSSDVTKWMDQAATKTAAKIALEEKLAKDEKEAKLALEAKMLTAKNTPTLRESARLASVNNTAPAVAVKVADLVAPTLAVSTETAKPLPTPTVAPVAEKTVLKLLSSVQPSFPRNAVRAKMTEGTVSARLHIETDGTVSHVDIIYAKPAKYFEQEVIAAASSWKYAPISSPQTKVLEFSFKLDN